MKIIKIILVCAVIFYAAPFGFAEDQKGVFYHSSFDRLVSYLKSNETQSAVQTGRDGIKVTCTLLPREGVLTVAWEIHNPRKIALDIEPGDIVISDQVRTYEPMVPATASGMLYGTSYEKPVVDPFIDAAAPSSYALPAAEPESSSVKDIFASAYNFGKNDSARIMGVTYYERYGRNARIAGQMKINGETLKFVFDQG